MRDINEGLEGGDLKRLVHDEMHIDQFRSKLGRDEDVIVVSFKVKNKEPARDLMNFCEKGYTWILDADISSGEMDDGSYVVFVECERNKEFPTNLLSLMDDLMNLTEQEVDDWRFRYHTSDKDHAVTEEELTKIVPLSVESYEKKFGNKELDKMKASAGVKVTTKAPKNDHTESLRRAAGII